MKHQEKMWDKIYQDEGDKWNKESLSLPNVLRNKSVLELGVGNGKTLKAILRQKPKEVIAIDFSKGAIELCKRKFDKIGCFKLIEGDVRDMPFEDDYFDYIICYYILNNLLEKDRKKAVVEIFRVLKKNGKVLFEDFAEGDFREKGEVIEKNTRFKKNGLMCHFFSEIELKKLFNECSSFKAKIKVSRPIKGKPHLIRRIFLAEIKK